MGLEKMTFDDFVNQHRQALIDLPHGSDREKGAYALEVMRLIELVQSKNAPKKGLHNYMQAYRARLDALIAHPVYQQNREKTDNFWVQFVQDAAHAFVAESEGMEPLAELGRSAASGQVPDRPS